MINANGQSKSLSNYYWNTIEAKGDVVGRHENGFVEFHIHLIFNFNHLQF